MNQPVCKRFATVSLREDSDGIGTVEGVAVRYGDVAPVYRERVEPGAFGDVSSLDLIANLQHQRTAPLARTGSGLTLTDTAEELTARIDLPDTTAGRDAKTLLKAGVLRGMSIEFYPRSYRMESDLMVVEQADLFGLALVDIPAYKASVASLRWNPIWL